MPPTRQVFFCNSDRSHVKERRYIESLLRKSIDGLIVVKPQMSHSEMEELNRHLALVLVDSDIHHGKGVSVINVDDEGGMRMGLQLLHENGHERIALISGLMESLSSNARVRAYKHFLAQAGRPFRSEYVIRGDYAWGSGYKSAKVFMGLSQPPTAIFAANDLMAMGCIRALHDMGLSVPGDVSVMGYDNIDMAKLYTPALTSVNQPKYDFGMRSAQMLLRRLEVMQAGEEAEGETVLLPLHIAVRESVGPVKGGRQAQTV